MMRESKWRTVGTSAAAGVVTLLMVAAIAADVLAPRDGIGVFAQLVHGARTTWLVAVTGVAIALLAGTVLGALATHRGGMADGMLSRFFELVGGYPTIVLVALLRAMAPTGGVLLLALALALVRVPETARLVRMEVVRLRAAEFHLAARSLGASPTRLLVRHIMPHLAGPLAQSAVFGVALLALLEAAMTFVGLGVTSDTPSWGRAIALAVQDGAPGRALPPLFALAATVVALYVLSDALRDGFDPRAGEHPPCRRGS